MTAPEWFEAALAVEPESRTLEVEGVEIAVRIWGPADAAKAAVLVHGGSANMRWWDHIAPMLGPERRVVALDLSGHGDSPRRSSYSVDEWSAEVAAVATMPGMPAKPTLIGHSMGGWVVLNCGVRHAEQIGGVVVLDSPVREPTPEQKEALAKRAFGPLKVYPDKATAVARFRAVPEQEHSLPYVLRHIAEESLRETPDGWCWKFDPGMFGRKMPLPDLLREVDTRVALFRSERGLVTPEIGEQMYEWLGRRAPVIELPLAGHHPMLDQPLPLIVALRTILADWEHSWPLSK